MPVARGSYAEGHGIPPRVSGSAIARPKAHALQMMAEDPLYHRTCDRVGFELVQPMPGRRLARVGVWPEVGQPVSVGWPTTQEAALHGRLGSHHRPAPRLDPIPLALGHPAVQRLHQVVDLTAVLRSWTHRSRISFHYLCGAWSATGSPPAAGR